MPISLALWLLLICVTPLAGFAQTKHFSGIVNPSLPRYAFVIHENGAASEDGPTEIQSIEVRSAGKLVQTIHYENDDDAPIDFAPGDMVTLQDIECNGYKDLLVRRSVGVHGDAWYDLYRFDPTRRRFNLYAPFSDLPYVGVDCKTGVIHTYVNSGAAGCMYSSGEYRWIHHKLEPVRIEDQEGGIGGTFTRKVTIWRAGKGTVLSQRSIPQDDCHRQ